MARDDALLDLKARAMEWWARPQPDGTLERLATDARKAKALPALLAWLPEGQGLTAERITRIRRRLEQEQ